jgi:flagella basal body P-ring formation protein FlgA
MIASVLLASVLAAAPAADARVAAAEAALRERLANSEQRLELSLVAAPVPIEGAFEVTAVGPLPPHLPRPRVAVPVQWREASGREGKALVWFGVEVFREVAVWARAARAGEHAEAVGALTRERDIARGAPDDLPGADLRGWRLARAVREGAPVRRADLEPVPVIAREQTLTLNLVLRGIRIEAPVVAQQDGGLGDWIMVRALGTGEPLRARVISQNEVELAH